MVDFYMKGDDILLSDAGEIAMDVGCCCPVGSGSYGYGREDDELEDEGVGGSGSGSGVIIGPPDEEFGVCCDLDQEVTLFGTVTDKTGVAVDVPTMITMPPFPFFGDGLIGWNSSTLVVGGCLDGFTIGMQCCSGVACGGTGVFSLVPQAADGSVTYTITLVSLDCSPFEAVFDVDITKIGCEGSFRITITL